MKGCAAVLLMYVWFSSWGLSQQAPSKPATPDRDAFTCLHWDLDLRIEAQTKSLFVRGKVRLRNDSAQPQTLITLQISSSLKWASIKHNGTAVPFTASQVRTDVDHTGNVQEAVITLPQPVVPGASIELEVGYSGTVSLDATRLAQVGAPLEVRAATDYDRIAPTFTCLRGVGHVLWFPVSLDPAIMGEGNRVFEETSAWAVRHSVSSMTVDLDHTVQNDQRPPTYLSNAQETPRDDMDRDSRIRFSWKHLGVVGPVLVSGNYRQIPVAQRVTVVFFPEHEAEARDYARVISDTPPLVTGRSSFPTWFIELPETQDAAYDADSAFLTPLKTTDRKSLEVTTAYLLAHQSLWSPRAWIYEGGAHLAQVLMRERQDGRSAAIAYMAQRLAPLTIADTAAAEAAKSSSLINTTSEIFYRTKAMYVWWMLREIVGERALLDALQQYDPEADKEPSYMQKLLEKNSHKDLEWFFDDWVYQDRGLPDFTVSNGYARPSLQGIFLVSATIENTGSAGAEVPVIVHTEKGDVLTRMRVPAHSKVATRVEVGSRPIDVTVNDGSVPEVDRSDNVTSVRIGNE